jgi:arylesterase/paraoxonase
VRPATRAAITAGTVVLVGLIALAARSLNAFGVFTDVEPGFNGSCTAVGGVSGPGDIAVDEKDRLAFISVTDRRAQDAGAPARQDGLYVLDLKAERPVLRKVSGTPSDFHPGGLSLYRGLDGRLTLLAINHRAGGSSSIDVFDVTLAGGQVVLGNVGDITGDELVDPSAIAAIDAGRFYVTNAHTTKTAFGRALDDDFVLPRANILFFNGFVFRVVATALNDPRGAAVSADRHYLYVGEAYNRRVATFEIGQASGALTAVNTLPVPSIPDKLHMDAAGHLWIGSQPKAFAMGAYRRDSGKPAPSQVFKVMFADGIPQSAAPVYTNAGGGIGGSSVAAVTGNTLLIGSALDNHILACRIGG